MKNYQLPTFEEINIDVEIDFGNRGEVQRIHAVSDFNEWISEELKFWGWLNQGPAKKAFQSCRDLNNGFLQPLHSLTSVIERFKQPWQNIRTDSDSLLTNLDGKEPDEVTLDQLEKSKAVAKTTVDSMRTELKDTFHNIIQQNIYIFRFEPEAEFVLELSKKDPSEAVFTLNFLIEGNGVNIQRSAEISGQVSAVLFRKNLNRKVGPDNAAFKTATKTWSRELEGYRVDYEKLKMQFDELTERNQNTANNWQTKTESMSKDFKGQLEANDVDLDNLKETYESHMTLSAPTHYWKKKLVGHGRNIQTIRKYLNVAVLFSLIIVGLAAFTLLPEFYPSDSIPWRNLGLFFLISTVVFWILRLLVKLLLSNIHLHADANERVVMIQTFLSMVRHKGADQGLGKENIAMALTPIFRPSTTGVIKDDSGPTTFGEQLFKSIGGK